MARKRRRKPHGQGCAYKRGKDNLWIAWREGEASHEGRLSHRRGSQ